MKIAYLSSDLVIHDQRLLKKMIEHGHKIYLFTHYRGKVLPDDIIGLKLAGIYKYDPFSWVGFKSARKKARYLLTSLSELLRFLREIRSVKLDIIHAGWIYSEGLLAILSGRRPILMMPSGSDVLVVPKKSPLRLFLAKYILKRADMFLCDCEHVKKEVMRIANCPADKIVTSPRGINLEHLTPKVKGHELKNKLGWQDKKILLMTRFFESIYGIEYFIRALPGVVSERPDCRIIMTGEGTLLSEIKRLAFDLGLSKKIHFAGFVEKEELPKYFSAADIYVSTSLSDGTSLALLEAMASALPVVVTDVPSNKEWVQDGENGFIVPRKDSTILAARLVKLLNDQELRERMGAKNCLVAKWGADWDKNYEKLEAIYKKLTKKEYQVCQRCIMDTSDPEIEFDTQGICNHCKRALKLHDQKPYCLTPAGKKEELDKLIARIKMCGKKSRYDCVIGLSGGVDSSYTAYLVKQAGLRPLAVHLDNGWDSELAVKNIENICKKLHLDLITYVLDWEEFKDLQLSFLKASTPDAEVPTDHAIFGSLYRVAVQKKIKYILLGYNLTSESILPEAWSQGHFDLKYIRSVQRIFGRKKLRSFPKVGVFHKLYYRLIRGIKLVNFLDYLDYDKERAKEILRGELGWRDYGAKHHESNYTKFFQAYILPVKFGFDKRRAHLSSLICAGQLTRKEAEGKLKEELYSEGALKLTTDYAINKLGISKEQFDLIMKSPPKTYCDYPNYRSFPGYRFAEILYRFVQKKVGAI